MAQRTWLGTTSTAWGTAGNWKEGSVPVSGDEVLISNAAVNNIESGLNQSAVTLDELIFEQGCTVSVGSFSLGYLQVATAYLEVNCSGGQVWLDVGASAITARVISTGSAAIGERGLYLKGSGLTSLSVDSGSVGLADKMGETSTVTNARVVGNGSLRLGRGVTVTTTQVSNGEMIQQCACTTANVFSGTWTSEGIGAITTLNVYGGTATATSSGTITTANLYGGEADFTRSAIPRTVTTMNLKRDNSPTVLFDDAVLTVTTFNKPSGPSRIQVSQV